MIRLKRPGGEAGLNKSELTEALSTKLRHLAYRDIELSIRHLLEIMSQSLSSGERIEIRGFGSFSLHHRPARVGRNPKTGEPIALPAKHVPHFKPGKALREKVDLGMQNALQPEVGQDN